MKVKNMAGSILTRKRFSLLMLVLAFGGVLFAGESPPAATPSPELLVGLSPEAAMALANAWGMDSETNKVNSYVTPLTINFDFPGGEKVVVDLPKDRMLVSIAPYIMKTHPCATHTMSSCRGEKPNMEVKVTATTADGQKLLEENAYTLPNGFLDLWLPRNLEIDVTVEALGLKASERITTQEKSNTCITTFRLHY